MTSTGWPGATEATRMSARSARTPEQVQCGNCGTTEQVCISSPCGPRCTLCFTEQVERSFRYAVQRSAMLSHGERVAVALSGGPASLALLELLVRLRRGFPVKRGKSRPKHFDLVVLHVSVPVEFGGHGVAGAAALKALVEKRYGLTVQTTDASVVSARLQDRVNRMYKDASDDSVSNTRDSSQQSMLLADTVKELILSSAIQHNCSKLFLGTTITRAATITIARVAAGSVHRLGGEIAADSAPSPMASAGEASAPLLAPRVLRPLREVSTREVVRYLRCVGYTDWITPAQPQFYETLESAAERFIWRASETRPATSFSVVHSIERAMK